MAQHAQAPKFGNWESGENISYTEYFENARKCKGGGGKNPNDPQVSTPPVRAPPSYPNDPQVSTPPVRAPPSRQEAELKGQMGTAAIRSKHDQRSSNEDVDLWRPIDSPVHHDTIGQMSAVDLSYQHYGGVRSRNGKAELEASKGSDVLRARHERQLNREEADLRRPTDSLLRRETVGRTGTFDSPHHRLGGTSAGETPKRVTRKSAGFDRSIDHSPLHPHYQARVGGKVSGVSSPSLEKKGSSESSHGLAPSTPGRSRLRSGTRGDSTPDHSPAVPRFGDWDESDPASADGYSHIFNQVREEKQSEAGKVPVIATETSYSNGQKQYGNDNSKSCCCFPWGRK